MKVDVVGLRGRGWESLPNFFTVACFKGVTGRKEVVAGCGGEEGFVVCV